MKTQKKTTRMQTIAADAQEAYSAAAWCRTSLFTDIRDDITRIEMHAKAMA